MKLDDPSAILPRLTELASQEVPQGDHRGRPVRRVLVVEDHPDTQAAVAELLAERGFEVAIASNGEAAMRAVRENRPDLVYLDMNLPEISGYDVCEQIRTDPVLSDIGIVMTSAQGSIQVHVSCLEAGADAFVPKPFELDTVVDMIEKIISARNTARSKT
jgi:two-component system, OmpR family, phosphate regulon response regulator PhoB